jgi:hypothetical protein
MEEAPDYRLSEGEAKDAEATWRRCHEEFGDLIYPDQAKALLGEGGVTWVDRQFRYEKMTELKNVLAERGEQESLYLLLQGYPAPEIEKEARGEAARTLLEIWQEPGGPDRVIALIKDFLGPSDGGAGGDGGEPRPDPRPPDRGGDLFMPESWGSEHRLPDAA